MKQGTMDNRIRNNGTRNKNIDIVSAHRTMRDKERDHETMRKRTKSWYVTNNRYVALRCFKCRELGHITHNCLSANMVSHNGNKQPGASSFSVKMAVVQLEEGSPEEVEVLESLPLEQYH